MFRNRYVISGLRRAAGFILPAVALLFALNTDLHPLFHSHKECGDSLNAQEFCLICSGEFQSAEVPELQELPLEKPHFIYSLPDEIPAPDPRLPAPRSRGPPLF